MREVESLISNKPYVIPEKHDIHNLRCKWYRYYYDYVLTHSEPILSLLGHIKEHTLLWDLIIVYGYSIFVAVWLFSHIRWFK